MSRPPLGQSVRGSCHHQPCSHSPSPTAEAPQPPMPSICLHVLFPGLGVLTAPSPPPLPILCHVPPLPGSLPWLPPTSGPLIASLECPQLSLPSFFAAQATLACFTIYRRPCSLQGGCAPGLYSAPPTAFLKHLLSVGATVASASLTINPTWSVFETLLGPPAPQPETLGAQLWLNRLGWSLCSRGPWVGVGAWLEVLGSLARPRVGHGRGLREDWGAVRKQGAP